VLCSAEPADRGVVITVSDRLATPRERLFRQLRRCPSRGCPWRGPCPDHNDDVPSIDEELGRFMRRRPFGAGRQRQRLSVHYRTRDAVRSKVTISSVSERMGRPPVSPKPTKIVHPRSPYDAQFSRATRGEQAAAASGVGPQSQCESPVTGQTPFPGQAEAANPLPQIPRHPNPADVAQLIRVKSRQAPPTSPSQATMVVSRSSNALTPVEIAVEAMVRLRRGC
jgi:hypothetical protein